MESNFYNEALTNEIDREREEDFQQQQLKEQKAAEDAEKLKLQQEQKAAEEKKQSEGVNDVGDVVKEVAGSAAGGVVKAASDLITTPERVVDLFQGQVDEDYEPDWNPLKGAVDYFKPKTWYGNLLQE